MCLGIVLLLVGGTVSARGVAESALRQLARDRGPHLVAFGVSAPQHVADVIGAARGATDLAYGNVVGSNISNLALAPDAGGAGGVMTRGSPGCSRRIGYPC